MLQLKISIITLTYNSAETIQTCITSVNSQTHPDIEHIIIDGDSKDNTVEIIQSMPNRISKIISEPDSGLYDALNKGIRLATGDIIGILHSDDLFFESTTIQKIVNAFQKSDADLVYANGQYVVKDNIKKIKRIYPSKIYFKRYLAFGWIPLHTTIFVKSEIYKQYGLYDQNYSIASDYEISLRWFKNDRIKKVFLNEWVVKMRLGGKSTNTKLQKLKSTEDLNIIRRYNLLGYFTLTCKIIRKIPQYLLPRVIRYK
jgi:glycosyltransferase involved in cell wall biosynthesis